MWQELRLGRSVRALRSTEELGYYVWVVGSPGTVLSSLMCAYMTSLSGQSLWLGGTTQKADADIKGEMTASRPDGRW